MIHPDTALKFISEEKGYGVVATKFIPKGTITWVFDPLDQVFAPHQIEKMHPACRDKIHTYSYRDHKGNFVLCWDHGRFVNHSFNSSCMSTAYNFELAVRDIFPGEELTDDYGYLNITEPFKCIPEPGTDRHTVYPDDLLRYHIEWDAKLLDAFRRFDKVPQPFLDLIEDHHKDKVNAVVAGHEPMDSILNCYYPGAEKVFRYPPRAA